MHWWGRGSITASSTLVAELVLFLLSFLFSRKLEYSRVLLVVAAYQGVLICQRDVIVASVVDEVSPLVAVDDVDVVSAKDHIRALSA